jgi:type IV pilus modification protein PilV
MQDRPILTQDAFSLIEVLIAIAIFSIGMLAVVSLQISSMNLNASSRRLTEATALASERMERLLALPYNHANLVDTDDDGATGLGHIGEGGNDADFEETNGIYNIFWNIAENQFVNNTKTFRVIVVYDNRGEQRQVVLQQVKNRE